MKKRIFSFSHAAVLVQVIAAFLLGSALCLAERISPKQWSAQGPGTLTCTSAKGTASGRTVELIEFQPNAAHADAYWCAAGIEFRQPQKLNTLSFQYKSSEKRMVVVKVSDAAGRAAYFNLDGADHWMQARFTLQSPDQLDGPSGPLQEVTAIQFIFNNSAFQPGEDYTLLVAGLNVENAALTLPQPLRHPNWLPRNTPIPTPGYRMETTLWNIWEPSSDKDTAEFNGFDQPEGMKVALDVQDHLVQTYKYAGIDFPYLNGPSGLKVADHFRALGGLAMAEGHNKPGSDDWLKQNGALATGPQGETLAQAGAADLATNYDITSPVALKADQERLLASAKVGAKAFRVVDYVWPWWGGGMRWGYGPNSILRWREDLSGTDTGLEIVENGKHRIARFDEYFASYHGYTPQPSACGLTSWQDFSPPKPGQADSPELQNIVKVYSLLFHYEWVKYANEESRPSVPYGLEVQPICNPESFDNGTDLYWLLKCAFVRGFCAEWMGNAGLILGNYYDGRYYSNIADFNHKEMILLGESAAAGGNPFYGKLGKPHYWDNQTNYLINYSQAASADFKGKNDQYWGSSWAKMSNPKNREYQSFTAFTSAWGGFGQSHNDHLVKPNSGVLAISDRSVARSEAIFDFDPGGQSCNLARDLVQGNYTFEGAGFPITDAFRLADYKTIVYSPAEAPQGFAHQLAEWLEGGEGRTLITHSFVPSRYSAPAPAPQGFTEAIQAGGQQRLLGFSNIVKSDADAQGGILQTSNPILAHALTGFLDHTIHLPSGLYQAPGGKTLVTLGGYPLVTERRIGLGRVIYLHFCPQRQQGGNGRAVPVSRSDDFAGFEQALMNGLMRYAGYMPAAITPKDIYALKFNTAGKQSVFVTYNAAAPTATSYGGEVFPVYQAQNPKAKGAARLYVGLSHHPCRLTDVLTLQTWGAMSDGQGYVLVSLNGWNMRGIRVEPQ